MKCTQKNVKELLPGYADETLASPERHRVEAHIESCADCGTELQMLRMMAAESVPDPGETFWLSLPGRVYRAVEEEKRKPKPKRWFDPGIVSGMPFAPRWAWGTVAALLLVAAVSFLLVRPLPEGKAPALASIGNEYEYDLAGLPAGVDLAELDRDEMQQVSAWADSKLTEVGRALQATGVNGQETQLYEYEEYWDLDRAALERFSKLLQEVKQEV
ncbi:MAG: hypothetical protein A2X56_08985 [Nitrospirae bacterium GWC2_57_13]|jgi:hypothetical protein|nr:MAG: hypothetical protein A2072_00635 [Nitrospirae bacterium GWC1_57_7]OGW27967.1 MAG: hypothetical protein A2X56_08985 [Nitrospirae bacterium GWC2_57_13]HAR45698.1 hypothetical protein [Nitrospiraceae bacterium]HAS55304.1 hypothetical protein [Nitrospiraceae bacterium]